MSALEKAAMAAYVRATPGDITLGGFGDFIDELQRRVVTSQDIPPIPSRACDWSAHWLDYEPGDAIGHGATEAEAIVDLLEQGT